MFYLEVVGCDEEENCTGHLLESYDAVKEALNGAEWVRFVVTELTVSE
ncbi:MAG: hypothetical protein SCK29_07105 [Bacillota bacterium]|nr:hypothetical protein [Bacillota bacterium]MDW7683873.1 hypothetical protein [Bacillota bacterium]